MKFFFLVLFLTSSVLSSISPHTSVYIASCLVQRQKKQENEERARLRTMQVSEKKRSRFVSIESAESVEMAHLGYSEEEGKQNESVNKQVFALEQHSFWGGCFAYWFK